MTTELKTYIAVAPCTVAVMMETARVMLPAWHKWAQRHDAQLIELSPMARRVSGALECGATVTYHGGTKLYVMALQRSEGAEVEFHS